MGLLKKKQDESPTEQGQEVEFVTHQLALDDESYELICKIKNQLIIKHKRPFNFSDAVRELKQRGERK